LWESYGDIDAIISEDERSVGDSEFGVGHFDGFCVFWCFGG
jgi:hypothetical protein